MVDSPDADRQAIGGRLRPKRTRGIFGRRVGSLNDVALAVLRKKILAWSRLHCCDHSDETAQERALRGQGIDPNNGTVSRRWYNYRMPIFTAAVGLAQLARIDWHLIGDARRAWYGDA